MRRKAKINLSIIIMALVLWTIFSIIAEHYRAQESLLKTIMHGLGLLGFCSAIFGGIVFLLCGLHEAAQWMFPKKKKKK